MCISSFSWVQKSVRFFFPASILSMLKLCGESVYQPPKGQRFFLLIRSRFVAIRNGVKYCTYEGGATKYVSKSLFLPLLAFYKSCNPTSFRLWQAGSVSQRIGNLDLNARQIDLNFPCFFVVSKRRFRSICHGE